MDRGLARRSAPPPAAPRCPTSVEADGVGRYPQQVEAAVYFCCLEALQNAGKHAGDGAEATITLREDEGALLFEVADDGAGFDLGSSARTGHGFVNMSDRVGAIGGTSRVESAPGQGHQDLRLGAGRPATGRRQLAFPVCGCWGSGTCSGGDDASSSRCSPPRSSSRSRCSSRA